MRHLTYIICIAWMLAGCSEDEKLSPGKRFRQKLSGSWEVSAVTRDHEDVSALFPGMIINFRKNGTFDVINPVPPIWESSGAYELVRNGSSFDLLRDDDVTIVVDELGDHRLVLQFIYAGSPGNRVKSTSGDFEFILIR